MKILEYIPVPRHVQCDTEADLNALRSALVDVIKEGEMMVMSSLDLHAPCKVQCVYNFKNMSVNLIQIG